MICCIVQPTFMPWCGFFALLDQSDTAVLLDSVAFSKQSWQQRNRIRTEKGLEYLTVPVRTAGRFGQKISDVEIANHDFVLSMESKIFSHYRKAQFFGDYFPPIIETLKTTAQAGSLAQVNIEMIRLFIAILGIKTPFTLSSTLNIEAERSILLTEICEYYSCRSYLSPGGASEYLWNDREIFERRNIKVFLQEFNHPSYSQVYDPFIPFASVLDLLFNEGPRSLDIIRSGMRKPKELIG
jgi:hypothetical protein